MDDGTALLDDEVALGVLLLVGDEPPVGLGAELVVRPDVELLVPPELVDDPPVVRLPVLPVVEAVVVLVPLLVDCTAPPMRYATTNLATSSPQSGAS